MTSVRRPKATLIGTNGSNTPLGSIQLRMAINAIPMANVSFYTGKSAAEAAQPLSSNEFFKLGASAQRAIFRARAAPDTTLNMDDGNGGTLAFKGYIVDPQLTYGTGQIDNSIGIIHESGPLASIDGSIYDKVPEEFLTPAKAPDAGRLDQRVSDLTKYMISAWKDSHNLDTTETAQEQMIRERVSSVNDRFWPIWYKILENSGADMDWPEILELQAAYRKSHVNGWILNTLRGGEGNFIQTMLSLAMGYRCNFVPRLAPGQYGLLRRADFGYNDSTRLWLPNGAVTTRLNGGSRDLLPITHALVQTVPLQQFLERGPDGNGALSKPIVAAYPETVYLGGGLLRDGGPPWLGGDVAVATPANLPKGRLDLNTYGQLAQAAIKGTKEQVVLPMQRICSAWARDIYVMESLRTSTAFIQTPLDLTMEVGDWYQVEIDGSGFHGLLSEVTHTLATHPSPNATTYMQFTHVETGDFKLPYRNP